MTREEMEKEAIVYALDEAKQAQKRHGLTDLATAMYMEALEAGYLAAAEPRERELERLREMSRGMIKEHLAQIEEVEAEADALRERVAELEGLVPRWVQENESAILNEQGWSVSETDKIGNGPRLWLMVPPIPLPEGEG